MLTAYTNGFWHKHGFGANTGFGMNTVCELFPHIHTEGFPCVGQGNVIFTANSCAVCQPNTMRICSNIITNLHHILCVKGLSFLWVSKASIGCFLNCTLIVFFYYCLSRGCYPLFSYSCSVNVVQIFCYSLYCYCSILIFLILVIASGYT